MTVKTDYARFDIHDELTAPAGSERLLKSISTAGGIGLEAGRRPRRLARRAARLRPNALGAARGRPPEA